MSQDNPQITTTPPLPGLQLVQDLNKALQTLATDFSGATDPAAMAWPYSTWADTGTGTLKRRNAANSAWMIERNLFEDLRRTTSATDTTAGRILKVGDFGVGIGGTAQITVDNVDRIDIPTGLYRVNNATTGTFPANSGSHYGTLIVEAYNLTSGAESFCQTFTRALNTPQRWFRYYAYNLLSGSPGWSDWVELYHSGNFSGVKAMTFAQVNALAADQGPIIVTDMGCMPWVWTDTAYFTGYRNPLCATTPQHFAATARAWEMPVTGGVWSESDPKQARLIAWFREQGLTVASGSWAKGWGRIADLGGGDWKAPDLQDVFLRMAGTDADTANLRSAGSYQADQMREHRHNSPGPGSFILNSGNAPTGNSGSVASGEAAGATAYTGGAETRGENTAVAPVVLI